MLTIESNITPVKSQAQEITNILAQCRTLLRKPKCKLQNFFVFCPIAMAISIVSMLVTGALMVTGHTSNPVLDWLLLLILFLLFFFSLIMYRMVRKLRDELMKHEGMVTVLIDEEGIDYDDHNGKKFKVGWNTVYFLREFKECIAFIPKETTGTAIFLERIEFNKIIEYMDEKDIELPVIRLEDRR